MNELEREYRERFETVLKPAAAALEQQLREYLDGQPRIDRIVARAKGVDRFLKKAQKEENGKPKYTEPLRQIQDQVGARIVTFYKSDVDPVATKVLKYYHPIEAKEVVPDSEWEFGYFGKHFVLLMPADIRGLFENQTRVPQFFELQVKTLFQHAWSEANHDLGYKPELAMNSDANRRLAFTSAQAWGADLIFDELWHEVHSGNASSSGKSQIGTDH
jgi:putative GTP pyrophosphokinase